MVYQYIVVLKNENKRYINIIGFLLSISSAALFLKEQLIARRIILPYFLGVVFITGLLVWNFYSLRKGEKEVYFSKALLIAGLVWTKMPYFEWLVFIFILLALLEYQAKHPLEIGFSRNHVIFNSLFRKKYNWSEFNNIVLKDGLLTLDFRSNRILQKEIDEGESEAAEEEFNSWCSHQLPQNK